MARLWRIYRVFFSTSWARELEFRANLIAKLILTCGWMLFFMLIIEVIFYNTKSLGGWNRGEALALAATAMMIEAISGIWFVSLREIPEQVRRGTLDFVVTKPVDTQFWVSLRKVNFSMFGAFVSSIALVSYAAWVSGKAPGLPQIAGYIWLLGCALVFAYSLNLFLMTLAIYFVRVDNLWVFSDMLSDISKYPLDIYQLPVRRFLTFAIPLAILGTIPVSFLLRGAPTVMLLYGAIVAVISLALSRWFWLKSLRRYTSASS